MKSDIFPSEEAYETDPLSDMRQRGMVIVAQHNNTVDIFFCVCVVLFM